MSSLLLNAKQETATHGAIAHQQHTIRILHRDRVGEVERRGRVLQDGDMRVHHTERRLQTSSRASLPSTSGPYTHLLLVSGVVSMETQALFGAQKESVETEFSRGVLQLFLFLIPQRHEQPPVDAVSLCVFEPKLGRVRAREHHISVPLRYHVWRFIDQENGASVFQVRDTKQCNRRPSHQRAVTTLEYVNLLERGSLAEGGHGNCRVGVLKLEAQVEIRHQHRLTDRCLRG